MSINGKAVHSVLQPIPGQFDVEWRITRVRNREFQYKEQAQRTSRKDSENRTKAHLRHERYKPARWFGAPMESSQQSMYGESLCGPILQNPDVLHRLNMLHRQ